MSDLRREQCLDLGFKESPHPTIMESMVYDLSSRRLLSLGCLGHGNEVIFLCEKSQVGDHYTDFICLHNRDLDGPLTLDRLKMIVNFFRS